MAANFKSYGATNLELCYKETSNLRSKVAKCVQKCIFVILEDTMLLEMNSKSFWGKILLGTLCCIFQTMKFDILRKSFFINQFRALILDAWSSQWYLLKRHLFLPKDPQIIFFTKAFVRVS